MEARQRVSVEAEKAVDITSDGSVTKNILKPGDKDYADAEGNSLPPKGSTVEVHYTGKLTSGAVFDSSVSRNQTFKFVLGARQVILGWDKAVATMRKGEKAEVKIAPDYAYGSSGVGPIPGNSTLLFDIELLGWRSAKDVAKESGEFSDLLVSLLLIALAGGIVFYFIL